jgi:hypothetical protein
MVVEIGWWAFYRIRRVFRGWLEHKLGRKYWTRFSGQGLTAYLDDVTVGRVLAWAVSNQTGQWTALS